VRSQPFKPEAGTEEEEQMPANSLPRRIAKHLLAPVLNERSYSVLQAIAMGWDIRSGSWREPELELLRYAIRPGETAIDVGANYGLYAYHLSRIVGPKGKVYCFEPIPFTARTFRLIQRGLRFTHNVELINKGASEKSGRAQFTIPVLDTGAISAGLVHMGRYDERPGKEGKANFATRQLECDIVAIDDYLYDLSDVALVKCDIEGADLFAMRGMKGILETHKPTVIIEIGPWYLDGFGIAVEDITRFFGGLAYAGYRYDDGRLFRVEAADIVKERNWVFLHPSRRERFGDLLWEDKG
jgi:FkbM family methyltransferase